MSLSTQRNNSKNDRPSKPIRFVINDFVALQFIIESFRFEDEDEDEDENEDEDEDEAFCFRHNEIFKIFRLQLGRDNEVDRNNIVMPSLSRL